MCPCPCAVEPVTRIRAPTRAQYAMSDPSAPECGDRQEIGRSEINMRSQHEIVDASRPPLAPVRAGSCATARTGSCAPPGAYAYDGLLTGVTTAAPAISVVASARANALAKPCVRCMLRTRPTSSCGGCCGVGGGSRREGCPMPVDGCRGGCCCAESAGCDGVDAGPGATTAFAGMVAAALNMS